MDKSIGAPQSRCHHTPNLFAILQFDYTSVSSGCRVRAPGSQPLSRCQFPSVLCRTIASCDRKRVCRRRFEAESSLAQQNGARLFGRALELRTTLPPCRLHVRPPGIAKQQSVVDCDSQNLASIFVRIKGVWRS